MTSGYFEQVQAHIAGNPKLREPQIRAYLRIKDHFDRGETEPAIVVLPTGTGKTGLMAIAPYRIAQQRALVITPSLVIRDGVMKVLDPNNLGNFWLQHRVILSQRNLPYVVEYAPDLKLEVLQKANFVVANIHKTQVSNMNSLLRQVPPDFFDMIIIDEAHHSAAQSWVDVERYFANAKVIKLTGTPFRTDNERIFGKVVDNYPLGRAMTKGYVKRLINKTWLPQDLTFTIRENGETQAISYAEALEIKESEWVSRQVAYSTECSRMVVQRSLEIMREKRELTGRPHKIIAVAMTIAHAQEIAALYAEAGAAATIIYSDQPEAIQEANLSDFVNDRAQIIVNVNMLGEGFDHPLISVAAVFRPFRSPLPYIQFAGRALRAIPDGTTVDNTAHLVYHKALDLDELWEYYKREQKRADIIQHLEDAEQVRYDTEPTSYGSPDSTVYIDQAGAIDEFASSFIDDIDVIKAYEEARTEAKHKADIWIDALREKGLPVDDDLAEFLRNKQEDDLLAEKRPDLVFREQRKRLPQTIEDGVADILAKYGLDPKGDPGPFVWPTFQKYSFLVTRNKIGALDGFLVALLNYQLKELIGLPRKEWSPADYERAQPAAEEFLRNLDAMLGEGR